MPTPSHSCAELNPKLSRGALDACTYICIAKEEKVNKQPTLVVRLTHPRNAECSHVRTHTQHTHTHIHTHTYTQRENSPIGAPF